MLRQDLALPSTLRTSPRAQTHRDPILAGRSGCSPGSRLAGQPGGTEHPLGDGGTHLARLTLPRGTMTCSPGLGGPRGGPRDAPSSPEPRGWAPQCSRAGRGCRARGLGTARRDTALTAPPCCCTHLLSFRPQDTGGSLREEGRGQRASVSPETKDCPGNATRHPPIPATSRSTGWSQPQRRPPALPNPLSAPGLGSHRSGQAAPTPSQETRP